MQERLSSTRHSRQSRPRASGSRSVASTTLQPQGSMIAGQTRLSLYAPRALELAQYVWRGKDNPAAARLRAKLDELGIS